MAGGENRRVFFHPEKYFYPGLPVMGDMINFRGPLTGMFSVLAYTGVPEVFVTACDMPFIFDKIIIIKNAYEGQDAIIPVFHGNPHPLIGVYRDKIKNLMEERIRLKTRAMRDLLRDIDVYYLQKQEV